MTSLDSCTLNMEKPLRLIDRRLSWLSFNHRVLQEAGDPRHPLMERLRFLAIFSSNLDEFFRVRVPALHALRETKLLDAIRVEVDRQQREFGKQYLEGIIPGLRQRGIAFVDDTALTPEQVAAAGEYWEQRVRKHIEPFFFETAGAAPFLYNRQLYLVVVLGTPENEQRYAVVEVPTQFSPRFVEVPGTDGQLCFMFLDDIVRLHLPDLFPGLQVRGAYSVKLTRDAELHLGDEFSGDLLEKIREALGRRKTGTPSRLLYDPEIPSAALDLVRERLALYSESLIPGWRYHNFSDFFQFPNPGIAGIEYEPLPPLRHDELDSAPSLFPAIDRQDSILHFPYHSYDYVIRFLNEAANDPAVTSIKMSLYRVASDSLAVRALIDAARRGKSVTAFIEMKARFDEEANFHWADELRAAGARVVYSLPGIKVHCKMCLVTRLDVGVEKRYAYLATGNFNEVTARVYTDHGLFTADDRLTHDADKLFDYLVAERYPGRFDHLLVAPFNMRQRFVAMLDQEIENARSGKRARVILKLNNLEDPQMIQKLSEAVAAGVEVRLIVRSVCCLPSSGLEAISIVDRFLEHGRVYIFHNDGDERCFIGSADWMTRNLSRRVEVVFPIFDKRIQSQIRDLIDVQLQDNVKARILDAESGNAFKKQNGEPVRSQMEIYRLIRGAGD